MLFSHGAGESPGRNCADSPCKRAWSHLDSRGDMHFIPIRLDIPSLLYSASYCNFVDVVFDKSYCPHKHVVRKAVRTSKLFLNREVPVGVLDITMHRDDRQSACVRNGGLIWAPYGKSRSGTFLL